MSVTFTLPDFIQEETFETIMEQMTAELPADLDLSEGSHPYNLLAPTAKQKEYFAQFILGEAIKLIFPKYCGEYDEIADSHGEINGIARKEAVAAAGTLKIEGVPGTAIPKGSIFSTAGTDESASVEFQSGQDEVIDENGAVEILVKAKTAGASGNVPARTVFLSDDAIEGVAGIINEERLAGGADQESTESLINRIVEYEKTQGVSFVGSVADYKRWAEEVEGIGTAKIKAAQDDSGAILIALTNVDGEPASETLRQEVEDHILQPQDPAHRLAPVNAVIQVISANSIKIRVEAAVEIMAGFEPETIRTEFCSRLQAYARTASREGTLRYNKVSALLSGIDGVADFSGLTMGGYIGADPITAVMCTENFSIAADTVPLIERENILPTT